MTLDSGSSVSYAQSGYTKYCGYTQMYSYTQYGKGSKFTHKYTSTVVSGLDPSAGDTLAYWQQWLDDCDGNGRNCLRLIVGNYRIDETPYDPRSTWVTPWKTDFFVESAYKQSDMLGTSTNPVKFGIMMRQTALRTFTAVTPTNMTGSNDGTSHWKRSTLTNDDSGTHFSTWNQ